MLLEIGDLKTKVLRLTEQSTKMDGDLSFLTKLSEQVDLIQDQIIKWRYRLPELTDDESQDRIVSAVEVREELDEFKEDNSEEDPVAPYQSRCTRRKGSTARKRQRGILGGNQP